MTLGDILAAAYPALPVLVIEQPDHAIPLAEALVAQGWCPSQGFSGARACAACS
jgi:hypothetical protein